MIYLYMIELPKNNQVIVYMKKNMS